MELKLETIMTSLWIKKSVPIMTTVKNEMEHFLKIQLREANTRGVQIKSNDNEDWVIMSGSVFHTPDINVIHLFHNFCLSRGFTWTGGFYTSGGIFTDTGEPMHK